MHFVVPADHPSLPGHFPGHPLVPGVVVLEHVLEALAAALRASGREIALDRLRLPQVKFVQPLLPAQPARVELQPVAGDGEPCARWRFRVLRDDSLLASGEVVAGTAEPHA